MAQTEQDREETQTRLGISENVTNALAYVPPLFFLPVVLKPGTPAGRFHARQSFILLGALFLFAVVVWVSDWAFGRVLGSLVLVGWYFSLLSKIIHYPVGFAVSALYLGLVIAAGAQAASGQVWRVPFANRLADRLPFWH